MCYTESLPYTTKVSIKQSPMSPRTITQSDIKQLACSALLKILATIAVEFAAAAEEMRRLYQNNSGMGDSTKRIHLFQMINCASKEFLPHTLYINLEKSNGGSRIVAARSTLSIIDLQLTAFWDLQVQRTSKNTHRTEPLV